MTRVKIDVSGTDLIFLHNQYNRIYFSASVSCVAKLVRADAVADDDAGPVPNVNFVSKKQPLFCIFKEPKKFLKSP